jgi:hypothetical protein
VRVAVQPVVRPAAVVLLRVVLPQVAVRPVVRPRVVLLQAPERRPARLASRWWLRPPLSRRAST